ncbi:MAG: rod shape-determining protein MreD [Rhodobacteraceae bacterium]|nr:rod shape-determining protein MreD [Paracoccaceae bacterium]
MIKPVTRHIWTYRAIYLLLGFFVMACKLLPLGLDGRGLPAPDILLAVTLAWLLRQPAVVPIGAIMIVFLLADFLFQRPPGLWTLLVLLASEILRRQPQVVAFPFLMECTAFAGAVFTLLILNHIALWLLMVERPSFGPVLVHGIVTVAIYPVVVAVSKFLFGLRKLGPINVEATQSL